MNNIMLQCEHVTVSFGAYTAVNDVSLSFEEGKLYGIIGPNGAGKTTLINAFSGLQRVNSGRILLQGEDVTGFEPCRRAKRGMGRSFQIVNIFPEMTVFENLRLAGQPVIFGLQPFWRSVRSYGGLNEKASEMLDFIGLSGKRGQTASLLSHGDQRRLEIGISLMNDPMLVLFDEPLAGVGHHEMGATAELVRQVARERTVILVEHNMDVVMSISDSIVVLVNGEVLRCDTPARVQADPKVREVYLGEDWDGHAFA